MATEGSNRPTKSAKAHQSGHTLSLRRHKYVNKLLFYYKNENLIRSLYFSDARSPRPPKSVHRLRPGDIDVIASMGDSLTAGFGAVATSLPHVLVENRGVSWSGGGQKTWREYLTLPNIIKVLLVILVPISNRISRFQLIREAWG